MVVGGGNPNSKIVLLGEACGREEDKQGIPFVGPSGRLMRSSFGKFLDLENDVFITNTVLCRPPGNRLDSMYTDICAANMWSILRTILPDIIITMGRAAYEAVALEVVSGSILRRYCTSFKIPLCRKNILVFPIVHPAFVIRDDENRDLWDKHVEFIRVSLKELNYGIRDSRHCESVSQREG